ncbi:hypothetical protein [Micromonospora palomenae]|uniref:hypothetical protein n=1 Tax=Micromonospora palomenae TaxID=1461247 RepID=UPI003F8BF0DC
MKIAFDQGFTQESREAPGEPWRRGYTFGDAVDAEWFAEIYSDVVLDKDRWSLREPVDRILVGAPLWCGLHGRRRGGTATSVGA